MKNFFVRAILLATLSVMMLSFNVEQRHQEVQSFVYQVEVDFGLNKEAITKTVNVQRQLTALEALQYAVRIETHPVSKYVFVSCIEDVCNIRGKKAWYYQVNGQSVKTLAINYKLQDKDTLRFIYKTDVCSAKVDKTLN